MADKPHIAIDGKFLRSSWKGSVHNALQVVSAFDVDNHNDFIVQVKANKNHCIKRFSCTLLSTMNHYPLTMKPVAIIRDMDGIIISDPDGANYMALFNRVCMSIIRQQKGKKDSMAAK